MVGKERNQIYAVRTTTGQEKAVAEIAASRVGLKKLPISAILVSEVVKGYVFIEATGPHHVDELISGVRHARSRIRGIISLEAIERFVVAKPVVQELAVGDIVEVTGGPFRGLRARIMHVDRMKEEVTIELLEEGFATLPITVHADYVRPVAGRQGGESGGKEGV